MGRDVEKERFAEEDYKRFSERLQECMDALARLLRHSTFGHGPATLGSELETFLIDQAGRPLPVNQKVLSETVDPRVTYELDRFNLECNFNYTPLEGQPFSFLGREMRDTLAEIRRAAARNRGRVAVIGILPTLRRQDLRSDAMTDVARYRALSASLRRGHPEPFSIHIDGRDPLHTSCEDVTFEGANTSLQIHLRVDPESFSQTYNAAQMATAPALAISGNSPTFLGHRLWEETRIALFKQTVDARPGGVGRRRGVARVTFGHRWLHRGVLELFAETVNAYEPLLPVLSDEDPSECLRSGGVPALKELRLHNGTIWRWNRPVYDPTDQGHLRIEMRALPAGPTVVDMLANAAFLVGLTLALAQDEDAWRVSLPFEIAHTNFYRAAQFGLNAELRWPSGPVARPSRVRARDLIFRLLPTAENGLVGSGVDRAEATGLLEVIAARATTGQTGSVWQTRFLEAAEPGLGRERALGTMLERYLECAQKEQPVHLWPLDV